jgi:serine peptidase DegS
MRAAMIFVAKWVLAGLTAALVLWWLRPELRPAARAQPMQTSAPAPAIAKPAAVPVPAMSYADAVARAAPAVVYIYTLREVSTPDANGNGSNRIEGSLGSGVIVDNLGHVVTNYHLITNARQIGLQLADGRTANATVVGSDPDTDLAVLQINLKSPPVMPLGSSDRLRVGDVVLAIGNPYGLTQTVTHGIVSATGRDQVYLTEIESFIQTDAAINAGNSGGALVDAQGNLVGINTAGGPEDTSQGIGFAIPVNLMRGVLGQILKQGRVRRGWLGVNSQAVSPEHGRTLGLAPPRGAELIEVYPGSPAALAGLQVGDVITKLNGRTVRNERNAQLYVAGLKPGSRLRVQGRGARGEFDVRVTIEERRPE